MPTDIKAAVPVQRSRLGILRTGDLAVPAALRDARPPSREEMLRPLLALAGGLVRVVRRLGRAANRVDLAFFVPTFVLYAILGVLLAVHYESLAGDAQARLANGYYVLFSRDPHMGAIGFVWNPLPSLSVMPLLLFKGIWPALATHAVAGNLASAAFMAGCVVLVHKTLREWHVRGSAAVILTVLFALQPMTVYYGANGMSEALFLFCLLSTTRRLSRWLTDGALWDLVLGGVALAFAYLARNEAVMPAMVAGGVVALVAARRARGRARARVRAGVQTAAIFVAPAFFAFLMWAVISWVIVGHPFEQFSSQYGNASQLRALGGNLAESRGDIAPVPYVAVQLAALAPMLPIALLASAWTALRRRDARMLGPLAILGGVVAFAVLAFLTGQTAGWLRYYIAIIPLSVLLAGCALSRPDATVGARWRWARGMTAGLLALAIGIPGTFSSAWAMADRHVGRIEHGDLGYIFNRHATEKQYPDRHRFQTANGIAAYLDGLHLPKGSILMDTITPCAPFIDLASRHSDQFVITNDRDFKPVLADPITFRAKYILIPPLGGVGDLDEINRTYPTMYASGAGIARLAHEFPADGCPAYRLYELRRSTGGA